MVEALQDLELVEREIAVKIAASRTGVSAKTVKKYMRTARLRGYDPSVSPLIKKEYVVDALRSGRPRIVKDLERNYKPLSTANFASIFWKTAIRV